jgi:hypothetical protein
MLERERHRMRVKDLERKKEWRERGKKGERRGKHMNGFKI